MATQRTDGTSERQAAAETDPVPVTALLVTVLVGVAFDVVFKRLTGRAEFWDAGAYWEVGFPLTLMLCAALGAWSPRSAALVGPLFLGAQFGLMILRNGAGPLIVVGLLVAAVLAAGASLAALFGAWCRSRARPAEPPGGTQLR